MKLRSILARVGITIAALGIFLFLRIDLAAEIKQKVEAELRLRKSPGIITSYIRDHAVRKLQIGAGGSGKPGWLNTDIEPVDGVAYLDATKRFPLPDQSFHYIFSEEMFEHITYEQGQSMLRESYRILAPGGTMRLGTPDLLRFIALFQDAKTKEMSDYMPMKLAWHKWPNTPDTECYILNMVMREWGHQFIYTPKLLRANLEAAGFVNIKQFAVSQSDHKELRNMEDRASWAIAGANAYENMFFEATRK